jgi:hypothetical protein
VCVSWVRFELGFGSILIIFIFYSLYKIILKKVYLFRLDRVRLIFIEFRLNCYGYVLQFYNQNYFFISWFRLWLSHSTMDKKTRSNLRVELSGQPWGLPCSRPEFDPLCARLSPPRCLTCSLGLQDVQWAVGTSRGVRKLARTPHANQNKKKNLKPKREKMMERNHQFALWWAEPKRKGESDDGDTGIRGNTEPFAPMSLESCDY